MTRYRLIFFVVLILIALSAVVVYLVPPKYGLDLAGGMRVVYEAELKPGETLDAKTRNSIVTILDRRVNATGVNEPTIQPKGEKQFIVEVPHSAADKDKLANELGKPTNLQFVYLDKVKSDRNPGAPIEMSVSRNKDGSDVYTFRDPQGKIIENKDIIARSKVILTGADLENAEASIQGSVTPVVLLQFKKKGSDIFADFTRKHQGDHLAIVLNGEFLSVPRINEAILTGEAQISGGFKNTMEAEQLAGFLRAGALPVPLTIVEKNIVEASLGKQYVRQSVIAGVWGIAVVAGFMVIYYLLPGFLATIALAMYTLFTFAIFKGLNVTLTLPGLAGFILSIGMAVDANILIFERMKEELRAGKTLHSAIDAGFNRAWTAILDSNVCTLITCLVLVALSSGPVVGFAKTLAIGVLVSMFTAVTVSRTLLHLVSNMGFAQNPRLYGLNLQWGKSFNVIGKTPLWLSFSSILIIVGVFFLATGGLKKGIDFTSGTQLQATFSRQVTSPEIREALASVDIEASMVQIAQDENRYSAFIRTKVLSPEKAAEARVALEKLEGGRFESSSVIGPSISREITQKAVIAVILACAGILVYLSFRFAHGGFLDGIKYGTCALFALIHDVLIVLGASAIFGKIFGWEIDGSYVTAVLTVIGFSVHDTIVVFDRIRENIKLRLRGETFEQMVNRSILQSFARSINTSMTVVIVLAFLLIFGGSVIRHFNAVMMVGIVIGTYSSIFVASPLLVLWERAARKAKGQLTAAELKPLVQNPTAEAQQTIGIGVETATAGGNGAVEADSAVRAAGKAKSKAAGPASKRRKRRF